MRKDYYTAEVATAQVLAEMWKAVGLNVEIELKENWPQVLDKSGPRGVRDWSNSAVFDDPVSSIVNQHGPDGAQQTNGEWTNAEMNDLSRAMESSTDMAARQKMFARMLQICERDDPAYIVLHQNAVFTGKRRDIPWRAPPSFFLDFSAAQLGRLMLRFAALRLGARAADDRARRHLRLRGAATIRRPGADDHVAGSARRRRSRRSATSGAWISRSGCNTSIISPPSRAAISAIPCATAGPRSIS